MRKYTISSPVVLVFLVILQTTLLKKFDVFGAKPDFVLIVTIIFSNYFGTLKGELYGAAAGLVEDFLTLSPFGFNTFVRTLTGYLAGLTKGKIFLDPLITPVILVSLFTLIKALITYVLLVFFIPDNAGMVFHSSFPVLLIMNILLTPFVFFLLKVFKLIPEHESRTV